MSVEAISDRLVFGVAGDERATPEVVAVCDARLLSDNRSWSSNGAWYGCCAAGRGGNFGVWADFDWVEYRAAPPATQTCGRL